MVHQVGKGRLGAHACAVVVAAGVLVSLVGSAAAQDAGIVQIPLGTVVRTAPGVETLLAQAAVPPEFVGQDCVVESRAANNSSVHPGNNLVVTSGGQAVVLEDVEGEPGKVTTATGPVRVGDQVEVTLVMGPHGVFSAGASAFLLLRCAPSTTTTTSTTTSTTSTTSSTTSSTTTTEVPVSSSTSPTTTATVLTETTFNTTLAPSTTTPPVVTTVPEKPSTLAFTGPGQTLVVAILGLVLLDVGYLLTTLRLPPTPARREE